MFKSVSSVNNGGDDSDLDSLTPESDDRGHLVVGERLPDEESVDSRLQPTQPVSVLPEKLREEYCAILREVQKEGVGCL